MANIEAVELKAVNTRPRVRLEAAEEEEEPLSPGSHLLHTRRLNCFIIVVVGCNATPNLPIIKDGLTQTLLKHPRFSSKLVFDAKRPTKPIKWVRTKVNLDQHLIVPDLDPNMDSPDQFVEDYVSNITRTPMDLSMPLWEIHNLNVKTSEATTTFVFRIHHSLGDGISLISLVLACTRKASDPDALPSFPTPKKQITYAYFLSYFLLFVKILWNTLIDLVVLFATTTFYKDTVTPIKGETRVEHTSKRIVHRVFSMEDIKLVKNAMNNLTINDVILGITEAGLSRYLNRKLIGKNGDEEKSQAHIPKHIRLRAIVMMNLRANTSIKNLAEMMEGNLPTKGWNWGNEIGYILFPFHIGLRDDPLDYIRNAKATIDRKKQSLQAKFTTATLKLLCHTFGVGVIESLTYNALSNTSICFSNVVGPMEEIAFYGLPATFMAPCVYGLPQGLAILYMSYANKVVLSLVVDEHLIPDPHILCNDIEESLKLAKNAIEEKIAYDTI